MNFAAQIILVIIATGSGCQVRMEMDANPMTQRAPLVTLVDTIEVRGSPARAYPPVPFPMASFPRNLWLAGIEGTAVVRVTVGQDGLVKDAIAIHSSMKEFEEPAVTAAKQWRFSILHDPAANERSGAIVDCLIKFSFEEEPNQAPEPTPGSVTPRASEGLSK